MSWFNFFKKRVAASYSTSRADDTDFDIRNFTPRAQHTLTRARASS